MILDQEEGYEDNADFRPNGQTNIDYEITRNNNGQIKNKSEISHPLPQKSSQLINKEGEYII